MTSNSMPTLRLAKLSHGRERQNLPPAPGSSQGDVATGESRFSRGGGCGTKSRGLVAGLGAGSLSPRGLIIPTSMAL